MIPFHEIISCRCFETITSEEGLKIEDLYEMKVTLQSETDVNPK